MTQAFKPFGTLVRATVQRGSNGLSRGFGFATFGKHEDAVAAVAGMNGFPVDGKRLKVSLKNSAGGQTMASMNAASGPAALMDQHML